MKVLLEQDKCVGSGQCVLAAEAVFDQRDHDGIAVLVDENPPDDQRENVQHAADVCPALAIRIEG
nr:ferredoxin [Rhodococcus sp. (in: high G+C Gram-positive bacteria)]